MLSHQVQFLEIGLHFSELLTTNLSSVFSYLATMAVSIDTSKQVISTHHVNVICKNRQDTSPLAPCTHEEADTHIFLHLKDAVCGMDTTVSICTVDTDVVVLAVASAQRLDLAELWIAFNLVLGRIFGSLLHMK